MPYVPGCSGDVFISYAHRDNQDGWVTGLKRKLTEKLDPFLAGHAEVWFDDRIRPGVYFKEDIQQRLKNTPMFVAVVSPSYLDSEFCIIDELSWFQNQGGREIIQLLKVPLEQGQEVPLPGAAYKVLHDEKDGHLLTGKPLDRILDEIVAAMTEKLRESWERRPKIYVAQVQNDNLKSRWEELKCGLHAEGYAVLPKGVLPERVPDRKIREWLEAARLSVHLDSVPDDPLAQRQLGIAKQIGRPVFKLPEPPSHDQLSKTIGEVQVWLESDRKPAVYFIYDYYTDHQRVVALPELIRLKTGFDVFLPEGGEKYHKFRLQVSDGVLLFRGDAPEVWLKSQEQALLQAAARPGRQAVEAKYFTRRSNGHSDPFRVTRGPRQEWVIERIGEPDAEDLQLFFDALRSRGTSAGGNV
jgi:hypothetical protein